MRTRDKRLVPHADLFNHRGSGGAHVVVRGCDSEKEEELRLPGGRRRFRWEEVFKAPRRRPR